MSTETRRWLNTKTLIGFTDQRGHAWHYRADEQGDEPNHYPGPIPVADVERRLFGWEELTGDVQVVVLTSEGAQTFTWEGMQGVVRPPGALGPDDKGAVLAAHSSGWQAHGFRRWLVDHLSILLDDANLHIASAGLLDHGAQAWVQIEVPDTFETPEGVSFRPFLLAATSLNATLSTTYKRLVQAVVCDNTLAVGLREHGQEVRIKHTSKSLERLTAMRDELALNLTATADAFSAEVARLTAKRVSDPDWHRFLRAWAPVPEKEGAAQTRVVNKHVALTKLWNHDTRVAPWRGTAYGVVAAVNTYEHHEASVRKTTSRPERNMTRAIDGSTQALDAAVVAKLESVLV